MKNITVSVDEELYHKARICAAERKSTVSGLVKKFLAQVVSEETEFDRLKREEDELRRRLQRDGVVFSATKRLTRDALHERHAVR